MPCTLTFTDGATINLSSSPTAPIDMRYGPSKQDGFITNDRIALEFVGLSRSQFDQLQPYAALDVEAQRNRARLVQLKSSKMARFGRMRWRVPYQQYPLDMPDFAEFNEIEGVMEVTRERTSVDEVVTIIFHRGNWLRNPDGTIDRFEDTP